MKKQMKQRRDWSGLHGCYRINCLILIVILTGVGAGMMSCSSSQPVVQFPLSPSGGKLMVIPFRNMTAVYGENVNVRSPLTGMVFTTGEVAKDADRIMTDQLTDLLERCTSYTLIAAGDSRNLLADMTSSGKNPDALHDTLKKIGHESGADYVVAGHLFRFQERIGGSMGVERPASAAFDLILLDIQNNRKVWTGHFEQTQQPLMDNLLNLDTFFKREAKWVTAAEMTRIAMEGMFRGCKKQ